MIPVNSGDIIINSIPVKAGRPCADIDCILEQRKTVVNGAGRAGRGGGGCRIRPKSEVGGWRIHVRT